MYLENEKFLSTGKDCGYYDRLKEIISYNFGS